MGIFSLFGKKNDRKENAPADKAPSKKGSSRVDNTFSGNSIIDDSLNNSLLLQRHIARATERKIDAIEYEMSRDIVKTKIAPSIQSIESETDVATTVQSTEHLSPEFLSTLPITGATTDYLLGSNTDFFAAALPPIESMPALEEAAILFASGQALVAEKMLMAAIKQDKLGNATQSAWYMLFDIYQIGKKQHEFESLSLDYANKFEMSPPHWLRSLDDDTTTQVMNEPTPSIVFPQILDSAVLTQLEKLQTLAQQSRSLRIDLSRIKKVDPVGCGLLLRALRNLRKTKHDLMLIGAQDLNQKIRSIIAIGRRDETETPWLLLLEILQLLHFEREFEEVSMDYCVTFEVSPPAFVPPDNHVNTSFPEITLIDDPSDRFLMPEVIEGKTDELVKAIADFAKQNNPVILDCSCLEKVEFAASAQLLSGLVPLSGQKGITIEFHGVNYPVMFLLNAMGFKNVASISPHKQ